VALTAVERTTTITFDDENEEAYITTYSRPWLTSLRANPDAREITTAFVRNSGGGEFIGPKKLVNYRRQTKTGAARKPRAPMTQEHKDKLQAGRLAKKAANA